MPVFHRREVPPLLEGGYQQYRPYVREDFQECCAYCLLHEFLAGGRDSFELDHFRPKSRPGFARFEDDFYNLYYACHVCNRYKGRSWPSAALESRGFGFVDTCFDSFSDHFREEPDGSWQPLTRRGEYTAERLRLNRSHLVEIRFLLRKLAIQRGEELFDWSVPSRERIKGLFAPLDRERENRAPSALGVRQLQDE